MQNLVCNFSLNRAVHLARCDIFFDMSVARARECLKLSADARLPYVAVSLGFLQSALEHAGMASRALCASPQEKSFMRFLQMVLCYLRSASALMENEQELKNTTSQLWHFLHRHADADKVQGFSRSSEQLLQDVAQLFEMAQAPLENLRRALQEQMSAEDRTRYQQAQDALRARCSELESHYRSHARPNFLFNS